MIDGDDKLSRRYGELPKEEPRAAIDEAILASARRAVAPRSFSQRWAVPVSLAAVLVLALGVTLRMQVEEPGIETSAPSSPPRAAAPSSAIAPAKEPAVKERAVKDSAADAVSEKPQLQKKLARQAPERAYVEERRDSEKKAKVEQKPLEANVAAEPPKPQPKAFADAAPPPASERFEMQQRAAPASPAAPAMAPPPAAAPAPAAAAPAARAQAITAEPAPSQDALRAKREAAVGAAGLAKEDAKNPLTKELERIAQLRREGRHQEADEALEKFRKENPSYKIPDALWEQVKPR